jgi:hypothetical protein
VAQVAEGEGSGEHERKHGNPTRQRGPSMASSITRRGSSGMDVGRDQVVLGDASEPQARGHACAATPRTVLSHRSLAVAPLPQPADQSGLGAIRRRRISALPGRVSSGEFTDALTSPMVDGLVVLRMQVWVLVAALTVERDQDDSPILSGLPFKHRRRAVDCGCPLGQQTHSGFSDGHLTQNRMGI